MSTTVNKELIRQYLEAINKKPKTAELILQYMTDQALIDHIVFSESVFPLYWMDVEEMIAEGDLVSLRFKLRGVHQGNFMGIPPTGKEIDVPGFITYRILGGKIVDHWMMLDEPLLMQQLGASQTQAQQTG